LSDSGAQLDPLISPLLDSRRATDRLRGLSVVKPLDATHVEIDGRRLINFSSNDYLGLSRHPRLIDAAINAVRRRGTGSGAAALICGYSDLHHSAAAAIAGWKQTESAVLLPSGYQANQAAVQTLSAIAKQAGRRQVRFLVDKLIHGSILDAVMGSGMQMRVYPHNNLKKLQRLLELNDGGIDVVATESIFSMDGDAADLRGLARLKTHRPFVLLLDEAHASGIYGPDGSGLAHALGVHDSVDVSVVTLSKALGGIGAAICGTKIFCDGVVNFGRAFIYTTNIPPAAAAAAEAAIHVLRDEPQRRTRLADLSRRVRAELSAAGMELPRGDSPIICCMLGSEAAALAASNALREEGLLVTAVRPPTVAPGSSRLRATLSAQHTDEEIGRLIAALRLVQPGTNQTGELHRADPGSH
jgi:8-amino-7-oxononanoate synthase